MLTLSAKTYEKSRKETKVFICDFLSDVELYIDNTTLLLIDNNISTSNYFKSIVAKVTDGGGIVLSIESGEFVKEYEYFVQLLNKQKEKQFQSLIVAGGGTLINLAYSIADHLNLKNLNSPIVVPTNTMSIADVAIGSLGLLNKNCVKNKHKVFCDPAIVVVSKNVFDSAPLNAKSDGMIEVIKHALVQEPEIFTTSVDAFFGKGDKNAYFDLAIDAMKLKIELQNKIIEGKESLKFLLTYGHSHAHVLEEYFNYKIPHSHAVYIGLLIDLFLTKQIDYFQKLLNALIATDIQIALASIISKIKSADLESIYLEAKKYIGKSGRYKTVYFPEIGYYADLKEVEFREFSFEEISEVIGMLQKHNVLQLKD